MVVPKLKNSSLKQKLLLFCAKDEKDKNSWITVLKDLNERLYQAAKSSSDSISNIMVKLTSALQYIYETLVCYAQFVDY